MRTLWLKREDGAIWDLAPRTNLYKDNFNGCWTDKHKGGGFKNKLTLQAVGKDFIPIKAEPEAQTFSMIARFLSERHKEYFNDFIGDFSKPIKMYCSPDGKIIPTDQISKPWYHTVLLTEGNSEFKDKYGIFQTNITLQYLESVWRRDLDIISTIEGVSGGSLVYEYTYPYFYQEGNTMSARILNEGDTIGCIVEIVNTGNSPVAKIDYTVYDDKDEVQRCRWNIPDGLMPGRKLVIDSRQRTQSAFIYFGDNAENVKRYGEEDISFINYPIIKNGENKFTFSFDRFDGVGVTIKYQQERMVI